MSKTNTRSNSVSQARHSSEDGIEELINKVCLTFAGQLEANIDKKFAKLDSKLNDMYGTLKELIKTINSNQIAVDTLNIKCDELEQHSKRNMLQLCNVPEEEGEDTLAVVLHFINDTLHISCSSIDINDIFRLRSSPNAMKPIIIDFVTHIKRNEVLKARKNLKASGIHVFECLTKYRYKLLQMAKKKYGNQEVWSYGGRVFLKYGGKIYQIASEKDLEIGN